MLQSQVKQKRIFIYSWPMLGHLIPILRIAQILQQKGNWKATLIISEAIIPIVQKIYSTIQFVGIKDQVQNPEFMTKITHSLGPKQLVFNFYMKSQNWKKHFEQVAQKQHKPDLILSDMMCVRPIKFTKENQVPLIINYPCSLEGVQFAENYLTLKRSFRIAGLTICYPSLSPAQILGYINAWNNVHMKSLVFIDTFIGFDKPQILPPNYRLIGPIIRKQLNSTKDIDKDLQFQKWMQKKKEQGHRKFIYVSFGTVVVASQQFVKMFQEVLIQIGMPVLWSLKAQFIEKLKHDNFFFRQWLPQIKILKRKEIELFVTHCGWNSTNEAIVYEKPLIVIPTFFDQPYNADQVCYKKIGVKLLSNKLSFYNEKLNPKLKKEKVLSQFREVLQNPMYKQNVKRLHKLSKFTKTEQIIINSAQQVTQVGIDHLINQTFENAKGRRHWQTLLFLIILAVFYNWF